jgi:hypothetical protein
MTYFPYTISGSTVSLLTTAGMETINSSHPNYDKIREALESGDHTPIVDLINIPKSIERAGFGNIKVIDGEVFYKGKAIHGVYVDRLLRLLDEGKPAEPMLRFLDNLHQNPTFSARKELPLFLQHNDIPLTPDGCFLAFKYVNDDLTSRHPEPDGTHRRHILGEYTSMPREEVNDDRNTTCAEGLHVASFDYVKGSRKVLICKVNPVDVVCIPYDYNNKKMRTCGYTPIGELGVGITHDDMLSSVVSFGSEYQPPAPAPTPDPYLHTGLEEEEEEEEDPEEGLIFRSIDAEDGRAYDFFDDEGGCHPVRLYVDNFNHWHVAIAYTGGGRLTYDTGHTSLENAERFTEQKCDELFN